MDREWARFAILSGISASIRACLRCSPRGTSSRSASAAAVAVHGAAAQARSVYVYVDVRRERRKILHGRLAPARPEEDDAIVAMSLALYDGEPRWPISRCEPRSRPSGRNPHAAVIVLTWMANHRDTPCWCRSGQRARRRDLHSTSLPEPCCASQGHATRLVERWSRRSDLAPDAGCAGTGGLPFQHRARAL